jgi:hypothetical protein
MSIAFTMLAGCKFEDRKYEIHETVHAISEVSVVQHPT